MVLRTFLQLHSNPSSLAIPKEPFDWPALGVAGLGSPSATSTLAGDGRTTAAAARWIWLGMSPPVQSPNMNGGGEQHDGRGGREAADADAAGESLARLLPSFPHVLRDVGLAPIRNTLGDLIADIEVTDFVGDK
jgi:hypothetical protein